MSTENREPGIKELVRQDKVSARAAYISLLGRGYASGGQHGMELARESQAGRWLRNRIKKAGQQIPEVQ